MNLYKKITTKPYSFSLADVSFISDDPLGFRNSLTERFKKLIMKSDEKIRDKKLQYNNNKEAAKY